MTDDLEKVKPALEHHKIPLDRGAKGAVSHTKNLFKQLKSPQETSDNPRTSGEGICWSLEIGIRSAADNRNHDVVMALSNFLAGGVGGRNPIDVYPGNTNYYYKDKLEKALLDAFSIGVASAIEERQPEILKRYGDAMILATRRGLVDEHRILDSFVGAPFQNFHRKIPELLERDGYCSTKEAFDRNLSLAKAFNLSGKLVYFKEHKNSFDYDVTCKPLDCHSNDPLPPATIATVPGKIAADAYNRLVQAAAATGGTPPAALHSPPPEQTRTMSMLSCCSLQ